MNIATARPYSEHAQLFWYGHTEYRDYYPEGYSFCTISEYEGVITACYESGTAGDRQYPDEIIYVLRHGPQPA